MRAKSSSCVNRRAAIAAKSRQLRAKIGFEDASSPAPSASAGARQVAAASDVATFDLLYESADSRLCLFETSDLHLMAVNASRLA